MPEENEIYQGEMTAQIQRLIGAYVGRRIDPQMIAELKNTLEPLLSRGAMLEVFGLDGPPITISFDSEYSSAASGNDLEEEFFGRT